MHYKPRILSLSLTRFINSIKHEHSFKILYIRNASFLKLLFVSMVSKTVKQLLYVQYGFPKHKDSKTGVIAEECHFQTKIN